MHSVKVEFVKLLDSKDNIYAADILVVSTESKVQSALSFARPSYCPLPRKIDKIAWIYYNFLLCVWVCECVCECVLSCVYGKLQQMIIRPCGM